MSRPQAHYSSPARPAFAPLQSASPSHTSSFSSTSSLASQSSASSIPLNSPTSRQPQHFFASMDQQAQQQSQSQPQQQPQQQSQLQQQQPQGPQRHPSFEYRPNREGAGQTAAETASYLSQMALLNEAAKRAQMAVVMRDLDGMEL